MSARVVRYLGVYDADGGLAGELRYVVGHLLGRTECALCDITHSPVRRRKAWDDYVASLPVPFVVLHRNERSPAERDATDGHEPCVIAETSEGRLVMLLEGTELEDAADVEGLARCLSASMRRRGLEWPPTSCNRPGRW